MASVHTNEPTTACSGSRRRMEKCLLSNEEVDLPEALLQDINVFTQIVSGDTWQKVLTATQRSYLMTFLPAFPEEDTEKKNETLQRLFASQTFKFNSPLRQFHRRLKEGKFSPDIAKYAALIRRARLQEYRHQQKVYYSNLLKEILISRQNILEQVYQLPPTEDPLRLNPQRYQMAPRQQRSIEYRVKRKVRKVIKEVNEECGLEDTSSEEEDDRHIGSKGRKQLFKSSLQESPPEIPPAPSVLATFASKPLMMNGESASKISTPSGVCLQKVVYNSYSPL
ncbi:Nuclear factor related to kappa-B-binding protein [Lamellibrachia satsuma]|nr:Nuclear factor related to kappa-B-binding protein [Lamellibrachia satsuma]